MKQFFCRRCFDRLPIKSDALERLGYGSDRPCPIPARRMFYACARGSAAARRAASLRIGGDRRPADATNHVSGDFRWIREREGSGAAAVSRHFALSATRRSNAHSKTPVKFEMETGRIHDGKVMIINVVRREPRTRNSRPLSDFEVSGRVSEPPGLLFAPSRAREGIQSRAFDIAKNSARAREMDASEGPANPRIRSETESDGALFRNRLSIDGGSAGDCVERPRAQLLPERSC